MTTKLLGRGSGIALTVLFFVGIPSMTAYADATCYTGCTTTGGGGGSGTGPGGSGGSGTLPPVTKSSGSGTSSRGSSGSSATSGSSGSGIQTASNSSSSAGGALPFTGADIEEMTAFGAGALLVGGFFIRRSRQRRRLET